MARDSGDPARWIQPCELFPTIDLRLLLLLSWTATRPRGLFVTRLVIKHPPGGFSSLPEDQPFLASFGCEILLFAAPLEHCLRRECPSNGICFPYAPQGSRDVVLGAYIATTIASRPASRRLCVPRRQRNQGEVAADETGISYGVAYDCWRSITRSASTIDLVIATRKLISSTSELKLLRLHYLARCHGEASSSNSSRDTLESMCATWLSMARSHNDCLSLAPP